MYRNEGARVRELALMAQLYAKAGEKEKAEQVISWSPVLEVAKEELISDEVELHQHEFGAANDLVNGRSN